MCVDRDVETVASELERQKIRRERSTTCPMAIATVVEIQVVDQLFRRRELTAGVKIVPVIDRAEYFARRVAELLLQVLTVGPGCKAPNFAQGARHDLVLRADGALGVERGHGRERNAGE